MTLPVSDLLALRRGCFSFLQIARKANRISFFARAATTRQARTLSVFRSSNASKISLASDRAVGLMVRPVQGPCAPENLSALSTLPLYGASEMQAFTRTEAATTPRPPAKETDSVNHFPALSTRPFGPSTKRQAGTLARTIFSSCPGIVNLKWFLANATNSLTIDCLRQRVNSDFSSRLFAFSENASAHFDNLGIVFPHQACASVHDKFAHIIEVSPLVIFREKQNPDAKSGIGVLDKLTIPKTDLPSNIFLRLPGFLCGIDVHPLPFAGKSWPLFRYWFPSDNLVDSQNRLRQFARPKKNSRCLLAHLCIVPYLSSLGMLRKDAAGDDL